MTITLRVNIKVSFEQSRGVVIVSQPAESELNFLVDFTPQNLKMVFTNLLFGASRQR